MTEHVERAGSQRERLLAWAQAGHVIHQDDFYSRGADGGSPIRAVRSRIPELEALGYGFDHTLRDDGTVEYRLAYEPDDPGRPPARAELGVASDEFGTPTSMREHNEPSRSTQSGRSTASDPCRNAAPDDVDEPRLFEPVPAAPRSALLDDCEADLA